MPALTIREAASLLGVTQTAVRKAIKRGTLRAHLIDADGPLYLVRLEDLDEYRRLHLRDTLGVSAYNAVARGDAVDDTTTEQAR